MFTFALSLFDSGLLIIAVILIVLCLIVLVKLDPSTEGGKASRLKSRKQNVNDTYFNKRRYNPVIPYENREESEEQEKVIKSKESASIVSVETKKPEFSRNNQSMGCPHHFGYLNGYPKDTPLPNECLICTKIVQCLARNE